MNNASVIFEKMRELIYSENFQRIHSVSDSYFIRKCKLTFFTTLFFIINQIKQSIGVEADKFCEQFLTNSFSKSAFSKARLKLNPMAFVELNECLVNEFYKNMKLKTFHGLTIFAIDGSSVQLPQSDCIINYYGFSCNQTNYIMPMAKASQLYDVLNEITVEALLKPYKTSERDMALKHIEELSSMQKKWNIDCINRLSIIIFDRGYPSISFIVHSLHNNVEFLMRSSKSFIKQVVDVESSGKKDKIIEISLKKLSRAEKDELLSCFPNIDLNEIIRLRVIIVKLDTGENEILITSLLDKKKYPYKIFKEFYFKRWGIESDYGFQKVRAEIENFSGKSIISVQQDFHSTILVKNATTLLAMDAQKEIDLDLKIKNRKFEYDINFSQAFGKMKNRFIEVLIDTNIDLSDFCKKMRVLMKRELEPKRPGRHFKRKLKCPGKKFHMNARRVA